jgi:SAM-dependent methyltransferase
LISQRELSIEEARLRAAYAGRVGDAARFATYSAGRLFNYQDLERRVLGLLHRERVLPLATTRILDVGCGSGRWIREWVKWGATPENLYGIDLRPAAIDKARRLSPPGVTIECGNAADLAFAPESFDIVLQSTVFTSILDAAIRRKVASEMLRVVAANGLILWYDFHLANPWNTDVRAVRKREIRSLFPDCSVKLHRITLVSPLARWLAPRSWPACQLLALLPPLRSHYVGIIRKQNSLRQDGH